MKKRQKNNEKARKEMEKVKGQKNPHFEGTDFEELLRTSGKFSENEILKILSDLWVLTGWPVFDIIIV